MAGMLGQMGVWLGISGVMLLLGIAGGMVALVMIPGNYFSKNRRQPKGKSGHPGRKLAMKIGKNVLGGILVIVGIVLTLPLVPGPGIVLLLLGVTLVDVPGKRRLQRYLISRPMVLKPINKLRARWDRPALVTK